MGDSVLEAKQHWGNFEKYVNTQQCYNTIASMAELCDAFWSFVYICKTYVDQLPKPEKVQILKMRAFSPNLHKMCAFSGKCVHFMQIR